ncbi:PD-(D/E)XK nuclease family protein, partial [Hungatella hathewayi]
DAYLEEEQGLILIDYKTDKVSPGQEDYLVKRYKSQLDYYQRALEQMTGKLVAERLIYSITLQKEIVL